MAGTRTPLAAELPPATLPRVVSWPSAVLVALGTTMLVTVSLGPMAAEIGTASIAVWLLSAAVGAVQCLVIAELACRFPDRAGGTSLYAQSALGHLSPVLGAVSSWGYWLAWSPGIAVNVILAARTLRGTVWPGGNTLLIALVLMAGLYGMSALGLRMTMRLLAVTTVLAAVPLLTITAGLLIRPSLLHADRVFPVEVPGRGWRSTGTWALMLKWTFVAAWSAYGAEMASTVVAEMRSTSRGIWQAMTIAGAAGVLGFGLVPILLLASVGADGLAGDPATVFLPAARLVFGSAGGTVVNLMLVAALVLGAQAFLIGSSRTIYQMAVDRHLPRRFAAVNRFGVPIGSIVLDVTVIVAFLVLFGERVVDIVAAANVAYLVVFILLPVAFISVRARGAGMLPRPFDGVAVALIAFNTVVLVAGGVQWGWRVMATGGGALLLVVPLSYACRRRRAPGPRPAPVTTRPG